MSKTRRSTASAVRCTLMRIAAASPNVTPAAASMLALTTIRSISSVTSSSSSVITSEDHPSSASGEPGSGRTLSRRWIAPPRAIGWL